MKTAEIMTVDPTTAEATAPLGQALDKMTELDIRHLPVVRDGEVVGVVSDRDLLESTGWMWNEEKGKAPVIVEDVLMSTEPMTVEPGDSVAHLARKLIEWGVGCAPVVEDGRLRGIATEIDVLRAFVEGCDSGKLKPATRPTVERTMVVEVLTLEAEATAAEARNVMAGNNVRHLPVVDELKVLGMVSDRDLRGVLGKALPGTTPVREFMSTDVRSVAPEDDLIRAARLMVEHKIGGLPVVDRGGLIGMITTTDLLEHTAGVLA